VALKLNRTFNWDENSNFPSDKQPPPIKDVSYHSQLIIGTPLSPFIIASITIGRASVFSIYTL
jgi:hypothetical protein